MEVHHPSSLVYRDRFDRDFIIAAKKQIWTNDSSFNVQYNIC